MTKLAGIAIATTLTVGCSPTMSEHGFAGAPGPGESAAAAAHSLTIQVDNQRPTDMRIYALNGGARVYVGEVRSRQSGLFRMPREALSAGAGEVAEFRLVADPIGSTLHQESAVIQASHEMTVSWLLRRGGGDRVRVF
jgi:hypothetical protein